MNHEQVDALARACTLIGEALEGVSLTTDPNVFTRLTVARMEMQCARNFYTWKLGASPDEHHPEYNPRGTG